MSLLGQKTNSGRVPQYKASKTGKITVNFGKSSYNNRKGATQSESKRNTIRIPVLLTAREASFLCSCCVEPWLHGKAGLGASWTLDAGATYRASSSGQAVLDANGGGANAMVGQGSSFCSFAEKGAFEPTSFWGSNASDDVFWFCRAGGCDHATRNQYLLAF